MTYEEKTYWNQRYAVDPSSGCGSEDEELNFKTVFIRDIMVKYKVSSIHDLGVGNAALASRLWLDLPPGGTYTGDDISSVRTLLNQEKYPHPLVTFRTRDITSDERDVPRDMGLCIDVLFHLSTPEKHQRAVQALCRSFTTVAVVAAWNAGVLQQYPRLASHCFFRPFLPPDGVTVVEERVLPMNSVKTLFVLCRAPS